MDGAGGSRPGGFRGGAGDRSIISPIMLRFRPIAPKPADREQFSGSSPAVGPAGSVSRRRVKRKYRVRVRRKNNIQDGNSSRSNVAGGRGTGSGPADTTATPQLLPRREDYEKSAGAGSNGRHDYQAGYEGRGALKIGGGSVGPADRAVVASRVTVESVGSACMGSADVGGGSGSSDVERVRSLELDTCPAFVTDSHNRVWWLNAAYVALVTGGGDGEEEADVRVEVAVKDELPPWWSAASFTCLVRVEHTWRSRRYSKLVPCDVWRLVDWEGFAWRLDVKAALSLGF